MDVCSEKPFQSRLYQVRVNTKQKIKRSAEKLIAAKQRIVMEEACRGITPTISPGLMPLQFGDSGNKLRTSDIYLKASSNAKSIGDGPRNFELRTSNQNSANNHTTPLLGFPVRSLLIPDGASPPGVGKLTPGPKDLIAQIVQNSSLERPLNASSRHQTSKMRKAGREGTGTWMKWSQVSTSKHRQGRLDNHMSRYCTPQRGNGSTGDKPICQGASLREVLEYPGQDCDGSIRVLTTNSLLG
ncbi:hypothetical protein TNCV_1065851 [Trichonephila clavipes]|nr:hypothetical protein TNCV_1065851 [Trichonephila clavipes]